MRWTILCIFFVLVSSALTDDTCPLFQQQIPHKTPSPIPLSTCSAQRLNISSALTFKLNPISILQLKNTGKAIESMANIFEPSSITGGILCDNVYVFNRIRFYINPNGTRSASQVNGVGSPLEVIIYFYNKKYKTFKNALLYRDGMVAVSNGIKIGSEPNPLFTPIQLILEIGLLKKPGSLVPLPNFLVYGWFDVAKYLRNYLAYPASFTDENNREFYCLTSIVAIPKIAYISKKQFDAFKNVLGDDGSPLESVAVLQPHDSRPIFLVHGDFRQIPKLY